MKENSTSLNTRWIKSRISDKALENAITPPEDDGPMPIKSSETKLAQFPELF